MKNINLISFLFGMVIIVNARVTMIIRHGEKIRDGSINLSPKGEARANCLLNVFGPNGTFVSPQKIFAQKPTDKKKSTRPRDTVIPLAKALNLTVDLTFSRHKTKELTDYIKNSTDEITLISWSKERIPEIVSKLGILNPPLWEKAYDEIWVITDRKTNYLRNNNYNNNINTLNNNKFVSKSNYLINQSKPDNNNNNNSNNSNNNFFFYRNNENNNILNENDIDLSSETFLGANVTLKF